MNKFLVIGFHDNDFCTSMHKLGEYLIEAVGYEEIQKIMSSENPAKTFTKMFELHVFLYQGINRGKASTESIERIIGNGYFQLCNEKVSLQQHAPTDWDNSETLVVNFNTDDVFTI